MKFLKQDQVVTFDIDETIVLWSDGYHQESQNKVEFTDPYDKSKVYLIPHNKHIRLLKHFYNRGYCVVVWSASGGKWANEVITRLNLQDYVHIIMSKPIKYVDDLNCNEWMGSRLYFKDHEGPEIEEDK